MATYLTYWCMFIAFFLHRNIIHRNKSTSCKDTYMLRVWKVYGDVSSPIHLQYDELNGDRMGNEWDCTKYKSLNIKGMMIIISSMFRDWKYVQSYPSSNLSSFHFSCLEWPDGPNTLTLCLISCCKTSPNGFKHDTAFRINWELVYKNDFKFGMINIPNAS